MKIKDFSKTSKLNTTWLNRVEKTRDQFLTGTPLRTLKAGYSENKKWTYVMFETERGIEEVYNNIYQCPADAKQATYTEIRFIK